MSWLDDAVVYEIYPQSFADSNGDGIGDLQGVVDHLDHLAWLGVNTIWFNPCFASRLDGLIEASGPALWVHGHTHTSFDYRIAGTRVVCNPKGYGTENTAFDPGLVVEIPD